MFNPMEDAPNFGTSNYPGGGEKIGPAWRAAWVQMFDRRWYYVRDLEQIMCGETGIAPVTARNLLRQARTRGLLEVRYEMYGNRAQAEYRRVL